MRSTGEGLGSGAGRAGIAGPRRGGFLSVAEAGILDYVTRVADGVRLDFDHESALRRLQVDSSVEALRAEGLDDAGVLDVVSLVALQNTLSRIRLALG